MKRVIRSLSEILVQRSGRWIVAKKAHPIFRKLFDSKGIYTALLKRLTWPAGTYAVYGANDLRWEVRPKYVDIWVSNPDEIFWMALETLQDPSPRQGLRSLHGQPPPLPRGESVRIDRAILTQAIKLFAKSRKRFKSW